MRKRALSPRLPAALLVAVLASPAWAAPEGATGRFVLGYRFTDVSGNEERYRQHLDYDDGPRLFDLKFDYRPPAEEEEAPELFDEATLQMRQFGGDPYESLQFRLRKFGQYDLRYRRLRSSYFYDGAVGTHDLHAFDLERLRDQIDLDVDLSSRASLSLGLERMQREGDSITTLDISRDEFELDRPIDETLDRVSATFEYAWDDVTVVLSEGYRAFDNTVELFLPGASPGEALDDPTELGSFFLDQPYDFETADHAVRVIARPGRRLTVQASALVQNLEADVRSSERGDGIDFTGTPFTSDVRSDGAIDRDTEVLMVDASYRLSQRVGLVAAVRSQELDQRGAAVVDGESEEASWDMETFGMETGLEVRAAEDVDLTFGVRSEQRDVVRDGDERHETDHEGAFLSLAWRPSRRLRLVAGAEDGSIDDPFTLASPTDRRLYKVRVDSELAGGTFVGASWRHQDLENATSGWRGDHEQIRVQAGLRREGRQVVVGYTVVEGANDVDRTVTTLPGFMGGVEFLVPVQYRSDADFLDARASWQLSPRFKVGGDLRFYENDGTLLLERDHLRGWLEVALPSDYLLTIAYRDVDYADRGRPGNDYAASILELGFGFRW